MGAGLAGQSPAGDRPEPADPDRRGRPAAGGPSRSAEAAVGAGPPMPDIFVKGAPAPPRRRRSQLNWMLTALPAFPLVLLVLRLWYLSRQDLPTMLLLVQN